jgi:leucyl aminopeptidase (aminopeptidase T)
MITSLVLAGGIGLILTGSAPRVSAAGPDPQATAQTLVDQCANIKQGDAVLISGTPRDIELLENIAVQVRKAGAFPLITIGSEKLARRLFDDVPAKFDAQAPEFELKLANIITAAISIESTDNPTALAGVSPERLAARAKTAQPVMDTLLKRNVRQVSLGNGLYPTAATAKQFGLPQEELSTLFWKAVNTDYSRLQNTGDSVRSVLAAGKEIQITNPNGTDLKFRIEKRPVFISDGVISSEDVEKGGPACQVWLPAGEVYTTAVAGTAEGKVVIDRSFFQGKEITGITLTFKAGKLTDMTAKSGLEPLKALYDAATGDKDAFGLVDIGINESLKIPKDSKLLSWIPAGMVTIVFGNNTWAGGTNVSSFDWSGFLPGSTLKVDGKPLVENGALRL